MGKQFQKMRRRLTVTGASQNIDGVARVGTQESQEIKKPKKKDKVSDFLENFKCFIYRIEIEIQIASQRFKL